MDLFSASRFSVPIADRCKLGNNIGLSVKNKWARINDPAAFIMLRLQELLMCLIIWWDNLSRHL